MSEKELLIVYNSMKWCHTPNDVPEQGEHYAILEFGQVTVAGYDRNDPPSSESKTDVIIFTDKDAWEHEIRRRLQNKYGSPYKWIPITLKRASIETTVVVRP